MHATGFLSTHLAVLQPAHGKVRFAGSDIANGWGGFIDGAIESGMDAAHTAAAALRNNN
jgi:monoamine oxidase